MGQFEYELASGTLNYYYQADGQRIALRKALGLHYLLNDHLGSTSVLLKTNGALWGEQRYSAWGQSRYTYGNLSADRQFTGQINDGDTGLYYYNARYYDPALHKFIQADTIVPDPNDPQTLNRYSYVNNNPVRYRDPSGHEAEPSECAPTTDCVPWTLDQWIAYGLNLVVDAGCAQATGSCTWNNATAVANVLAALNGIKAIHGMELIAAIFAHPSGGRQLTASLAYDPNAGPRAVADVLDNTMRFFTLIPSKFDVAHEIGHLIDFRAGRNRKLFSSGAVPAPGAIIAEQGAGGYWTAKVPGWQRSGSSAADYSWSVNTPQGMVDRRGEGGPWEDFGWTFAWSIFPQNPNYKYPSDERRAALEVTLDIAGR